MLGREGGALQKRLPVELEPGVAIERIVRGQRRTCANAEAKAHGQPGAAQTAEEHQGTAQTGVGQAKTPEPDIGVECEALRAGNAGCIVAADAARKSRPRVELCQGPRQPTAGQEVGRTQQRGADDEEGDEVAWTGEMTAPAAQARG